MDELDFDIDPELDEFAGQVKQDTDLIKKIELAITAVLVLLNIACIDEDTHNKIVSICLKDERCTKGYYDHVHLQNLIKSELTKMLKNGRLGVFMTIFHIDRISMISDKKDRLRSYTRDRLIFNGISFVILLLVLLLQDSLPLNPQKFGAFNLSFAINTHLVLSLIQTGRSTAVNRLQVILPRWLDLQFITSFPQLQVSA